MSAFPSFEPADIDTTLFINRVDQIPDLKGLPVLYFDGEKMYEMRPPSITRPAQRRSILVSRVAEDTTLNSSSAAEARESKLYSELVLSALSCGGAVVSWIAVVGSAAAAPVTGGGSTFLTILTYSAATATSLQCGNSVVRIYNEANDPESNDWLDSQEWYSYFRRS